MLEDLKILLTTASSSKETLVFRMPQFKIEPFELKIRQDPHRKVNA
ncbi:hypothetical protein J7E55_01725 [Bacillus sp. ISL-53]|nr:hypothetical protein [Bacillus sp. ISL-53]